MYEDTHTHTHKHTQPFNLSPGPFWSSSWSWTLNFILHTFLHPINILPLKHTHPFNGPFSGTTQVSRYQKGKTNLDFTEARDSEWQWHQLGHMQVCILLQTDNHASTPPLCFLQAGCPSCRPTNSVKALKATVALKLQRPTLNNKHCISVGIYITAYV